MLSLHIACFPIQPNTFKNDRHKGYESYAIYSRLFHSPICTFFEYEISSCAEAAIEGVS